MNANANQGGATQPSSDGPTSQTGAVGRVLCAGNGGVGDTTTLAHRTKTAMQRVRPPGPRTLQRQNRLRALQLVNRFRQLRSLDLAAGLFPEREYKAALSAVQRITKALVARKMLRRYRSLSGQTYYALGEPGARTLRESGDDSDERASASASRVCEKTNPEHDLWAAFAVLCSEARGMKAINEKELIPHLVDKQNPHKRRKLLTIRDGRGQCKGLMPDALAYSGNTLVWYEIDRSERGSVRLADLLALICSCGVQLSLGSDEHPSVLTLTHIIVMCKTERIYRKHVAYVTGANPKTGVPRLCVLGGQPALNQVAPGVYEVMRDVEQRHGDGRVSLQSKTVGKVHFQMLPVWLPGFSYRPGSRHDGWFADGYLPFKNAPRGWPALSSPADAGRCAQS